jgi:hypothetical protein
LALRDHFLIESDGFFKTASFQPSLQ